MADEDWKRRLSGHLHLTKLPIDSTTTRSDIM